MAIACALAVAAASAVVQPAPEHLSREAAHVRALVRQVARPETTGLPDNQRGPAHRQLLAMGARTLPYLSYFLASPNTAISLAKAQNKQPSLIDIIEP